jgi:hypothetical protein
MIATSVPSQELAAMRPTLASTATRCIGNVLFRAGLARHDLPRAACLAV